MTVAEEIRAIREDLLALEALDLAGRSRVASDRKVISIDAQSRRTGEAHRRLIEAIERLTPARLDELRVRLDRIEAWQSDCGPAQRHRL
jgi:hypothetical protein